MTFGLKLSTAIACVQAFRPPRGMALWAGRRVGLESAEEWDESRDQPMNGALCFGCFLRKAPGRKFAKPAWPGLDGNASHFLVTDANGFFHLFVSVEI